MRVAARVVTQRVARVVATCAVACTIQAHAAEPTCQQRFRVYGSDAGLLNPAIFRLVQDSHGFIWLTSEDGVFRYDGQRFTRFGEKEGIPSDLVYNVVLDKTGVPWVGSLRGPARFTGTRFVSLNLPGITGVSALTLDAQGALWIGGGAKLYRQTGTADFAPAEQYSGREIKALGASRGRIGTGIWVSALRSNDNREPSVESFDGQGWATWPVENPPPAPFDAVLEDPQGHVWARSPQGVWRLDRGSSSFRPFDTKLPPPEWSGELRLNPDGHVLVPSIEGIYEWAGERWEIFGTDRGLPTPWARDVLFDREGSMWVAAMGLYRELGRGLWQSCPFVQGKPSTVTWAMLRDHSGQLWAATDRGLLEATHDAWKPVPGTTQLRLTALQEGPDQRLWTAGASPLLAWDPKTQKLERFEHSAALFRSDVSRLLFEPGRSTFWVATWGNGLFQGDINAKDLGLKRVVLPDETPGETFVSLSFGKNGRVWAPGSAGLAVLENGKWQRFTQKDGLFATHVFHVLESENGDLHIAYLEHHKLGHFRYENSKLVVIDPGTSARAQVAGSIYSVGEDSRGRVWIGTGRGMTVRSPDWEQQFSTGDGLIADDIANMAFMEDPSGDIWVGTSSGVARFLTSKYRGPDPPPKLDLLSAHLGSQAFGLGQLGVAHPKDNVFETTFASLVFAQGHQLQYQVRLDGVDTEWQSAPLAMARYAGLSSGNYHFHARARLANASWGPTLNLDFRVLPRFYETWWFRALLGIAALLGIREVVRFRVRSLRRRNQLLEEMVQARTRELASANAELADANEALKNQSFTDPLTGLKNRRFLAANIEADVARTARVQHERSRNRSLAQNVDLTFLMIDLDHFKLVNDQFGHAAGDRILAQTAKILSSSVRDADTVVRWGGEEFLIMARDTNRREVCVLAERIRKNIEKHPFELDDGRVLHRTTSIGFACFPLVPGRTETGGWEQIVDYADQCLYIAKRSGRNQWIGFLPEPNFESNAEIIDVAQLALQNNPAVVRSEQHPSLRSLKPVKIETSPPVRR